MRLKRAKRVRMHLIDPNPSTQLPSVEGLLVAKRAREYVVALPSLIVAAESPPAVLESRLLVIPRANVAFYEIIG